MNYDVNCKICAWCGNVINPELQPTVLELVEFAPIDMCEEPEMFYFHGYTCIKKWLNL